MKVWKDRQSILRLLKKKSPPKSSTFPTSPSKQELPDGASKAGAKALSSNRRREILSRYGHLLERCASGAKCQSDLPFPKTLIRQAILEELAENPDGDLRSPLEVAFVQLESFLPHEELRVIEEFQRMGALAQEMAKSGDPMDIVRSARMLRKVQGESAVKIQERISDKMRKRLDQIRSLRLTFRRTGPHTCVQEF